jgi:hypothetical protein
MSDINVTIAPPDVINVTFGAEQGPPGPPGADGGDSAVYVADGAVSGHVVVAETAPGTVVPASADSAAHALRVAGISTNAAANGGSVTVRRLRAVTHGGWAFTPDLPVYLGLSGALVQAVPVGALFIQVVGVALTPTSLLVAIHPPVFIA